MTENGVITVLLCFLLSLCSGAPIAIGTVDEHGSRAANVMQVKVAVVGDGSSDMYIQWFTAGTFSRRSTPDMLM